MYKKRIISGVLAIVLIISQLMSNTMVALASTEYIYRWGQDSLGNGQLIENNYFSVIRNIDASNVKSNDTVKVNYVLTPKNITINYDDLFSKYGKLYRDFRKNNDREEKKQYWFVGKNNFTPCSDRYYIKHGYVYTDVTNEINGILSTSVTNNISATAYFEENYLNSQNLEIVDKDTFLSFEKDKIKGSLNIRYDIYRDSNIHMYKANPIVFSTTFRIKSEGTYTFSPNNNKSFVLFTVNNNVTNLYLEEKAIIIEKLNDEINSIPNVTIEVKDAQGVKDKYEATSQEAHTERYNKFLENPITLKGDAYANFSIEGTNLENAQYQFLNQNAQPINLPQSGWKDISLSQNNSLEEDVIKNMPAHLTWRGYNVNDLQVFNDNVWRNPEDVFSKPFQAIGYKSTEIAAKNQPSQYGHFENIPPYTTVDNGNSVTVNKRWMLDKIFTNEVYVTRSESRNWRTNGYSEQDYINFVSYKDADKFWGYIKPDRTGYYNFGLWSDDGSKAYITVNNQQITIGERWLGQAPTFFSANNKVRLEKDKYYPIYLQYFNYGERAIFKLKYKYSENASTNINFNGNTMDSDTDSVPSSWFYPSKTNTPGEYASSIFTGSLGVKFPDMPGKYYIAVKVLDNQGKGRTGFYGPFIVEGKTPLTLSRTIVGDKNSIKQGDNFTLNYTIKPENIPITDIYKDYNENANINLKSQLTVKNIKFHEVLPPDIVTSGNNSGYNIYGQDVYKDIGNLTYNLDEASGVYKADSINFSLVLKGNSINQYTLGGNGKSLITYEDIDSANRQKEFKVMTIEIVRRQEVNLTLSRNLINGRTYAVEGRNFDIDYTIKPENISKEDIDQYLSNKVINNTLIINGVEFSELIPSESGLIPISASGLEALDIENNYISGKLPNLVYSRQSDGSYAAPEMKFRIKFKAGDSGNYILGENNNTEISYVDFYENDSEKYFKSMNVSVEENKSQLALTRSILSESNEFQRGNTFDSEYVIQLRSISLLDYFDDEEITRIQNQGLTAKEAEALKLASVKFEEEMPIGSINNAAIAEGIIAVAASGLNNFSFNNSKVTGNLSNISYTLNSTKDKLVAQPVKFTVKFKGIKPARYILGENESSFISYSDLDGREGVKVFDSSTINFQDITIIDITNPAVRANMVPTNNNSEKYTITINVTEVFKNGSVVNIKSLSVSNGSASQTINVNEFTEDNGSKIFIHDVDKSFLKRNNLTITAEDIEGNTTTTTVPVINIDNKIYKVGSNNINVATEANTLVNSFIVKQQQYITNINTRTDATGKFTQQNVSLIEGYNIVTVRVTNEVGNSTTQIFNLEARKTEIQKYGVFSLKDNADDAVKEEDSFNVTNNITQNIGILAKYYNDYKISIGYDNSYANDTTKLTIYKVENGRIIRNAVTTVSCRISEINSKLENLSLVDGATYIIIYTVIPKSIRGVTVTNSVKVDNEEFKQLRFNIKAMPNLD